MLKERDEETHVRLAIRGRSLDCAKVSSELGVQPTLQFSRGDAFIDASGSHTRAVGLWALDTTDFVHSDDLSHHINELAARIKPGAIEMFLIDPEVSVQVYLWWVGDEGTMGFGVQSDLVRKLCNISNEINASFIQVDS